MRAGEASSASATFDGTLVITAPSGKQLGVGTTFDTGSDTDAVSVKMATKLIELGCSWGDAGGGIVGKVQIFVPSGRRAALLHLGSNS